MSLPSVRSSLGLGAALIPVAILIAVGTGGLLAFAGPLAAQEEPSERIGETTLIRNEVRGTPPEGEETPLAEGDYLLLEHRVATGEDSAFKMSFDPGGTLTLGSSTRVLLDQAAVKRASGPRVPRFRLDLGSLLLKLNPRSRGERKIVQEIEVETPTSVIGVKGTSFRTFVYPNGLTVVTVLEGVLRVLGKESGESVKVRAGERTVIEDFGPPSTPSAVQVSADEPPSARGGGKGRKSARPRLKACPKAVIAGRLACACGVFPTPEAAAALRLDGHPLGIPVTISTTSAMFRIPGGTEPGKHLLSGDREAGFAKKDRCELDVFSVESNLDRDAIRRGGDTQLRLRVGGTNQKVKIRLRNRAPRKIRLEGGAEQTVTTSGGSKNTLTRKVKSLGPTGEFSIDYTVFGTACPCSGDIPDPSSDPEVLDPRSSARSR